MIFSSNFFQFLTRNSIATRIVLIFYLMITACTSPGVKEDTKESKHTLEDFFVVPGEDEPMDSLLIQRGNVLVSYADCYLCHREKGKAKGPAFSDIAKKYPYNSVYVDLLARKNNFRRFRHLGLSRHESTP